MLEVTDCSLGVNFDAPAQELPPGVWTDCKNMRFARGFAERIGGVYDQLTTPVVTPYWIGFYETATSSFWVHAGLNAVYVDDGSTQTDITGSAPTGAIDDRWTGGVLGGMLVINNGKDLPMYWNGNTATNLATLTGWDANWVAESIRPYKQFLIAMNITKSGTNYRHMVKWSAAAVPGSVPASWDETDDTIDAREIELAETSDPTVDGLPLGDSFIVYKERSMYRLTYIGGEFVFQSQRIPAETGMLARGCGCATPLGHVVLASGDVILFDGQSTKSIADGVIKEYIFNSMDTDNFERSFVVANPIRKEVLVCFPTRGQASCDKAAVWNWELGKWGQRDLTGVTYGANGLVSDPNASETWASDSDAWSSDSSKWYDETLTANQARLMLCRTAPAISAYDFGGTDNGSAMESYLERTAMAYDESVKLFKDVYLTVDAPAGAVISVELGAQMLPSESPIYQTAVDFTVGTDFKVNAICKGRAVALKLSHNGTQPWRLRKFKIGSQPAGRF